MANLDMDGFWPARVFGKRSVARSVCELSLGGLAGERLPAWEPGAHIDVLTPAGERRSYSLTGQWPPADDRYVIAVARAVDGGGGSASMHDSLRVGDTLLITPPVNTFAVTPAARYLLIAGGVGITPIRSMYYRIRARGDAQVTLVYLVRSRKEAAYIDEFAGSGVTDVVVHAADESGGQRLDLWSYLREPATTHLYACASPALIDSVRRLTAHWRPSRVTFESFSPGGADVVFTEPFDALWAPTGATVHVPAGTSLLDALRAEGVRVPSSCRAGTCGVCRVAVLSGTVDHRDVVLDERERRDQMTSCVSRGTTNVVVGPKDAGDPRPAEKVPAGGHTSSGRP